MPSSLYKLRTVFDEKAWRRHSSAKQRRRRCKMGTHTTEKLSSSGPLLARHDGRDAIAKLGSMTAMMIADISMYSKIREAAGWGGNLMDKKLWRMLTWHDDIRDKIDRPPPKVLIFFTIKANQ